MGIVEMGLSAKRLCANGLLSNIGLEEDRNIGKTYHHGDYNGCPIL